MNREEWLQKLTTNLSPLFETTLPIVHVSVGFPSIKGTSQKNQSIGQCWPKSQSKDKINHIFINPALDDSLKVAATMIHELIHAIDDCKHGHRGPFRAMAKAIGLEGKMTATTIGDGLRGRLNDILKDMDKYPHAALDTSKAKKQKTRLLKLECAECGNILRGSAKVLESGTFKCSCDGIMQVV